MHAIDLFFIFIIFIDLLNVNLNEGNLKLDNDFHVSKMFNDFELLSTFRNRENFYFRWLFV